MFVEQSFRRIFSTHGGNRIFCLLYSCTVTLNFTINIRNCKYWTTNKSIFILSTWQKLSYENFIVYIVLLSYPRSRQQAPYVTDFWLIVSEKNENLPCHSSEPRNIWCFLGWMNYSKPQFLPLYLLSKI